MAAEAVQTYILDDDRDVAASVGQLLAAHGSSYKILSSIEDFLSCLPALPSGCAIVNLPYQSSDGLELLKVIRQSRPDIPVIFVTRNGSVRLAVQAMKLGAVDFLEGPYAPSDLLNAVAEAGRAIEKIDEATQRERDARSQLAKLSPRERTVLINLLEGRRMKTVAAELGISPRTVETYRASIMRKLGVRALPEAARLAFLARCC